uniref:uncharacterized protein LOC120337227 n=1 Tax=Styela clava TaxID=7725 RepID=UPI0019395D27|nr:uncharacterized protein LOC120337227 [Styela clava]
MSNIFCELPNEIWIKILRDVSLEDRMKNIQFVNKQFHSFCSDRMLTFSLNFENCIFMSDRLCLQILRNAKPWLRKLSFHNCHWFPSSMFGKFSNLLALRSLDLRGCILTPIQLKSVLCKTPNVKSLVISSYVEDIRELYRLNVQKLNIKLDTLHIDVCGEANIIIYVSILFELFALKDASSVSFDIPEKQRNFIMDYHLSPYATTGLMYSYVIDFVNYNNIGSICRMLSDANLHYDENGFAANNGLIKLENLKNLILPTVRGIPYDTDRPCRKANTPSVLPNLEYLNVDFKICTLCKNCYGFDT